ncbi:MAG: GNAT family N-acetyltransferase [Fimbriimonadaceae bacterium]|nr:GNAT family N-acetyltransferase [Fimbriimonadaceae bacterium]
MHTDDARRGWETGKVRLVSLDFDRHFENCLRWINDPDVTHWLIVGDYPPISRLAEKDWFESASKDRDRDVLFAIETLDGVHIGNTGVHAVNHVHRNAMTGSMIGEKSYWGQGYGKAAAIARSLYCYKVMNLERLFSSALEGNVRSFRMLTGVGYTECGRMPKRFFKRGRYWDEILLCQERDAFLDRFGDHPFPS